MTNDNSMGSSMSDLHDALKSERGRRRDDLRVFRVAVANLKEQLARAHEELRQLQKVLTGKSDK